MIKSINCNSTQLRGQRGGRGMMNLIDDKGIEKDTKQADRLISSKEMRRKNLGRLKVTVGQKD